MKFIFTIGTKLRIAVVTFFALTNCIHHANCQFTQNIISASQLSTGLSKNISTSSGIYGNPSILPSTDSEWLLSANVENRYFTNLLGSSASVLKRIDDYSYGGLLIGSFGFDEYRESELRAIYARKLSEVVSIGSTIKYNRLSIQEFGDASMFNINLGLSVVASEHITLSGLVENILPDQSTIESPFIISAGFQYELSSAVQAYGEYEYIEGVNHTIKAGVMYELSKGITVHFGFLTSPSSPSIGLDITLSENFSISLGTLHHQALGVRGGLGLNWIVE